MKLHSSLAHDPSTKTIQMHDDKKFKIQKSNTIVKTSREKADVAQCVATQSVQYSTLTSYYKEKTNSTPRSRRSVGANIFDDCVRILKEKLFLLQTRIFTRKNARTVVYTVSWRIIVNKRFGLWKYRKFSVMPAQTTKRGADTPKCCKLSDENIIKFFV